MVKISDVILFTVCLFGLAFAFGLIATIIYDLMAKAYGWTTISQEAAALARTWPLFAIAVACHLSLSVGLLIGHLFLCQTAQNESKRIEHLPKKSAPEESRTK
jgi:hypothetical protein